jgi:hypothetical protein
MPFFLPPSEKERKEQKEREAYFLFQMIQDFKIRGDRAPSGRRVPRFKTLDELDGSPED